MDDIHPDRWRAVRAVLDEALELPPERRDAFVAEACGADDALRHEIEGLLSALREADGLLDAPLDALAHDLLEEMAQAEAIPAAETTVGRRVGPYRLLKPIGRGGMGAVHLAERADGQFEQKVAVKLLRRDLHTPDVMERFLAERQILASLTHPHIARLLDGGLTKTGPEEPGGGRPYFVMEHVEGESLHIYCDRRRLPVRRRLELFTTVCEAVDHAHRNLVVHRDLKPSNILVADDGTVKLVDFGIAKLLDDHLVSDPVPVTRTARRWMTPGYAAPEQIGGGSVTTATDVYQLGAVLYELLSGHRPFEHVGRRPYEVERAVLEDEPRRPSATVTRASEPADVEDRPSASAEAVSRARSTTPKRLRRTLQGDLDAIVLKALRKEPDARYRSAGALLEDVERHLEGLPVVARRGTTGYRARAFVRRHRRGVGASAALALLLGGFATFYTVRVTRERNRAQLEAEKSAMVTDFLMDLFEASDPGEALGGDVTARELLERGLERVDALRDQPEVQAEMLDVVGGVYGSLGSYQEALPLLERSLAMRRELLGREHPDVAVTMDALGLLALEMGDFDRAEIVHREALAMRRRLLGDEHVDVAHSLNNLALVYHQRGDYEAAEPLYREALALDRELLGEDHPDYAVDLNNLGGLLTDKGDYDAAEALYREGLAIQRRQPGEIHPQLARLLANLGTLLFRKGDNGAAEPLLREALTMRRELLGEEHPDVAVTMNNLAAVLREVGDYAGAEDLFRQMLEMNRGLLGDEHPEVALSLHNLGSILVIAGEPGGAEPHFREAVRIQEAALGEAHWVTAYYRSGLGACLTALGRYAEAERLLLDAHAMLRSERGDGNTYTRTAMERLVALYDAWDRPDRAAHYRGLLESGSPTGS